VSVSSNSTISLHRTSSGHRSKTKDVAILFFKSMGRIPRMTIPRTSQGHAREHPVGDPHAPAAVGANFVVAERAIVVATNEGNADLSAHTPPLHICSVGIEKIIPTTALGYSFGYH
jgi:L-lactate dehydrogenase complex protein LldF